MTETPKGTSSTTPRPGTPNYIAKRFYQHVAVAARDIDFEILLDDKRVRTPAKNILELPSEPLADAIAGEWRAQQDFIDPSSMPLTRLANTAIDGVANSIEDVRADIAKYAASDLLCYRAEDPEELVRRQSEGWDPVIRALQNRFSTAFSVTSGIMPTDQPAESLAKLDAWLSKKDAFAATPLHVITSISGSCMLAIAHAEDIVDIETLWHLCLIDEDYQMELWGRDTEATSRREHRWREIESAARFMQLTKA